MTAASGRRVRVTADELTLAHQWWVAGWDAGYAAGRQAACEDMARSWLHDMARKHTEEAVRTATTRHGAGWGQTVREQAEAVGA